MNFYNRYWDWAANATPHPLISTEKLVAVIDAPEGNEKEIKNPLFSYHFQTINESFTGRFAKWHRTLRWPTDQSENAKSQPELFIRLQYLIYVLLQFYLLSTD